MSQLNVSLNQMEIWKTLEKIRTNVLKGGIDISKLFKNLDRKCTGFVSESKFINILCHQLGKELELCREEVCALASYFKVKDGCIQYTKLLDLLKPLKNSKKDFVTGLEWEDPMHVNRLAESEERHLGILLTKIAQMVRLKDIVLQPYFKDYEDISQNNGVVTIPHFQRVLYSLGITVSTKEFQIIVKKFIKDSYTLNYIAFIQAIDNILEQIESQTCKYNFSNDLKENYPGKTITVDFPKLPRPEIGTVNISRVLGQQDPPHTCFKNNCEDRHSFELIMLKIKKHIFDNSINICGFFEYFDKLRSGFITISQFVRALESIGISGLHRLQLSQHDINLIIECYKDFDRVCWKYFCEDIDEVFSIKNLDKQPYTLVQSPPEEFDILLRECQEDWTCQSKDVRELAEHVVCKIKESIKSRRIFIEPFFKGFDRTNNFHVSKSQCNRVFAMIGFLFSEKEIFALQKKYCDDMGFNYWKFLEDVGGFECHDSTASEEFFEKMKLVNCERILPCKKPRTIVEIIATIRGHLVRNRVDIKSFLKDSDPLNHQRITYSDFKRGLSNAKITLNGCEEDILCDCFKSTIEKGFMNYKWFCEVMNEALIQTQVEKNPLMVPLQIIPSNDSSHNFMNFEERTIVSKALQKLAVHSDIVSNLSSLFEDYDRHKSQFITKNQFLRALSTRNILNSLSSREFETLCNCFAVEKGCRQEFHYRNFLQMLSLLNATKEYYPF